MEKHLFNLKFAAKELNRSAKKCDKEEKAEKAKIKKAIQKGNMEVARIHAENAIRQKNQAVNFLRMSARVDAVAARVQTAVTMGKVTKSMAGVVKSMDATLKTMNLEKISALMDKFEHQFETLDVQTQQMEDTMSNTTTLTTPQNQVDMLLQEMADEAGLDLNMELPQGQTGSVGTSVASAEQDELSQRLARLRDQVWPPNESEISCGRALCVLQRDVLELCQNAEQSSKNLQPPPDNAKKFQFFSTSNWILKLFIAYDDVYFYSCLLTELVHLLYINLGEKNQQNPSSRVFRFHLELSDWSLVWLMIHRLTSGA